MDSLARRDLRNSETDKNKIWLLAGTRLAGSIMFDGRILTRVSAPLRTFQLKVAVGKANGHRRLRRLKSALVIGVGAQVEISASGKAEIRTMLASRVAPIGKRNLRVITLGRPISFDLPWVIGGHHKANDRGSVLASSMVRAAIPRASRSVVKINDVTLDVSVRRWLSALRKPERRCGPDTGLDLGPRSPTNWVQRQKSRPPAAGNVSLPLLPEPLNIAFRYLETYSFSEIPERSPINLAGRTNFMRFVESRTRALPCAGWGPSAKCAA
jgi:hypothetical protein